FPDKWDLANEWPVQGDDPEVAARTLIEEAQPLKDAVAALALEKQNRQSGRDLRRGARSGGTPQAAKVLAFVREASLFHTEDGDCYGDVEINGHRETWPLKNKNFRLWLARAFFQETGKAPGSTAMTAVLEQAAAWAAFDGPTAKVFLR